MSAVPFKANAAGRQHIPQKRHRVTNWPEYDAALRQRGSLAVWFTEEAIAAWRAEPRTTRSGQPHYSALAVATGLTLRAVFRLALRQTEGLIGSIIRLLGLHLAIPDHSTLSRPAETLEIVRAPANAEPVHLLVDSTGLKLSGAGEWLVEEHGTSRRRSWRKLHIGVDADTGQIVAAALTTNDVDDGSQVGPLLDQMAGPLASFTGDGAYDQEGVYGEVAASHPDAMVIVSPRSSAVPSETAETAPTERDRHLQLIAERGRMGWQKASGYNWRALVEADIGRWKRAIGDALRSQTDTRQATEVAVAVNVLNGTACWRWGARITSAPHETDRASNHCVHRLIYATRCLTHNTMISRSKWRPSNSSSKPGNPSIAPPSTRQTEGRIGRPANCTRAAEPSSMPSGTDATAAWAVPGVTFHAGHQGADHGQVDLSIASVQHLVRFAQCCLAMHTGYDFDDHRLIGIAGQWATAPLRPRLPWREPLRPAFSAWLGFCPFDSGRLELSGVFGGSPSLASSSAIRRSAVSSRWNSARISASFSASLSWLRSGRWGTPSLNRGDLDRVNDQFAGGQIIAEPSRQGGVNRG
jgi:hypothetical protein